MFGRISSGTFPPKQIESPEFWHPMFDGVITHVYGERCDYYIENFTPRRSEQDYNGIDTFVHIEQNECNVKWAMQVKDKGGYEPKGSMSSHDVHVNISVKQFTGYREKDYLGNFDYIGFGNAHYNYAVFLSRRLLFAVWDNELNSGMINGENELYTNHPEQIGYHVKVNPHDQSNVYLQLSIASLLEFSNLQKESQFPNDEYDLIAVNQGTLAGFD